MAIVIALCGLGVAACGSSSTTPAKPKPKAKASSTQVNTTAQAAAAYTKCETELGGIITAEKGLDARLNVGMPQAEYGTAVGNVSVAYSAIDPSAGGSDCAAAGLQFQKAFTQYTKANTLWNNCVTSPTCTNDSIKSKLQVDWAVASADISLGEDSLNAIKT